MIVTATTHDVTPSYSSDTTTYYDNVVSTTYVKTPDTTYVITARVEFVLDEEVNWKELIRLQSLASRSGWSKSRHQNCKLNSRNLQNNSRAMVRNSLPRKFKVI